jgi:hypothetical protein
LNRVSAFIKLVNKDTERTIVLLNSISKNEDEQLLNITKFYLTFNYHPHYLKEIFMIRIKIKIPNIFQILLNTKKYTYQVNTHNYCSRANKCTIY